MIKKSVVLAVAYLAFACAPADPDAGTYKVAIPIDDGNNHYSLQTKELHSVTDIYAMAGTAAVFKADGRFDVTVNESGHEFITGQNYGSTPSAHFIRVGDVLHPADFLSLSMTTAMYHFENIKAFYDSFGATANISFPRNVLVNVVVNRIRGDQEQQTINNASYVERYDLFWINPYKDDNVPLTFNGGVLAHEYLHNVFMSLIASSSSSSAAHDLMSSLQLNEWKASDSQMRNRPFNPPPVPPPPAEVALSQPDTDAVNKFMFASLNEGIADYFGYEYTGNPAWIVASLPTESFRDLSGDKTFGASVGAQKERFLGAVKPNNAADRLDPHGVGAYFSHFLWTVSKYWGSDDAKRAALDFMKNYAELLLQEHDRRFISMGELVRLFFKYRAPGNDLCPRVIEIFPAELNSTNFSCGDVKIISNSDPKASPSPSPSASPSTRNPRTQPDVDMPYPWPFPDTTPAPSPDDSRHGRRRGEPR